MLTLNNLLLLFICFSIVSSQNSQQALDPVPIVIDPSVSQPVNQHNTQQMIEIQHESQIQQQLKDQLPLWIKEQIQQTQTQIDLPITETFTFVLQSQQQVIFKWNPSKEKELKLIVDVFYLKGNENLVVIQDVQENQYVEITAKNPNATFFGLIGKVYRSKILTVDFDTDFKQIKFANKNSETVLIEIDIQRLSFVVSKGVVDDSLSTARTKMQSIFELSKSTQIGREHVYKWQWGFLENQKNHQKRILGLTGIELLCMLITACVQMYCIKRLLDNRAVV